MNLAEQWNPVQKPSHKRQKPRRAAKGKFSTNTILEIFERDNGACVKCKTRNDLEAVPHHVIFKSQGGAGTADNGVTICRSCHRWAHACREGREWFEQYREQHLIRQGP